MKKFTFIFLIIIACEDSSISVNSYMDHQIIYTSRRWWNYDIYIGDIYGFNTTHLTKNKWIDFNPTVSFDGSKIAFISDRDGNREVYVMELNWMDGFTKWEGKNLINITNSPENDWFPKFSPVSYKIVYASYFPSNDNYDIFTMNYDGSGKKNITNSKSYEKYPQFSVDGSYIIYQGWVKGKKDIFFSNLLETNRINLTNNPSSNDVISLGKAFSPDGNKIVFTSDRDGSMNIYKMNSEGSNHEQLTFNEANDFEPAFSPDGSFIVFTSLRDGNKEIYIMDNNGLNMINISNNEADDWNPRIFPDSKKIVFQSLRDGSDNWEIYVMNMDGTNQKNISNYKGTDYSYVVLPLLKP